MPALSAEQVVWKNKKRSVFEGAFYAVMVAFGESLIIPCALSQGLRPTQIAIVATFPVALGGLSQFLTPWIDERLKQRKAFAFSLCLLQAFGLGYLAFVPQIGFYEFLVGSVFYWIGGAGLAPLWVGWMIPNHPSKAVELYHARRNALLAFISFTGFLVCGALLYHERALALFQKLFLVAGVMRFLGGVLLLYHHEAAYLYYRRADRPEVVPHLPREPEYKRLSLLLILVLVFFRMGAGFGTPHFTQYKLENLHLSYFMFTFLTGTSWLGRTLLLERWITSSHQFGTKNTLLTSCFIISFLPVLWLIQGNILWFFGLELVGGGAWACFELLTIIILAGMGVENWSRYVGLLGMLVTFAALVSGWAGGAFLELGYSMALVFTISTLIRLMATVLLFLVFSRYVKQEVAAKKMIPIFFSTLSLRPSFWDVDRLIWRKRR